MKKLQTGFSIVSAIFLLVVLAALGAGMVTFSTNQQQTVAMDVMGARAYQAARAGVEWGAFGVISPAAAGGELVAACVPGGAVFTKNLPAGTLAGTLGDFSVNVACIATDTSDVNAAGGTVRVYQLTSTANRGVAGTADYVERQIRVSIAP